MRPIRIRLFVLVFICVATAISVNALYLQDARYAAGGGANMVATQPDAASRTVTAAIPQTEKAERPEPPAAEPVREEPKIKPKPRAASTQTSEQLLRAIARELNRNGYEMGDAGKSDAELRAAIIAYEFDQGMPMTGEPTEAILKSLLFGASGQGARASAERFETRRRLIAEVQEMLAGLGYGGGPADGRLDERTRDAIRKFEGDRSLSQGGRLTPRVLLEMVVVSGRPFAANG